MKYFAVFLAMLTITACASRTTEQGNRRNDVRLNGSVTLPMPQSDGSIKPVTVPIDITIAEDETTNRSSDTKSGVDMDQVRDIVNTSIRTAMAAYMPASAGSSFLSSETISTTLNGIMAALMGYLALAKRSQIATFKKGKPE